MVMYAKSGNACATDIQPVRRTEQSVLGIRALDVHRAARCACHVRSPAPAPRQLAVAVRVAARHTIAAASLAKSVATSARATATLATSVANAARINNNWMQTIANGAVASADVDDGAAILVLETGLAAVRGVAFRQSGGS